MKKDCIFIVFFIMLCFFTCKNNKKIESLDNQYQGSRQIDIQINIGSHYFLKKFGILKSNHKPQTVVWIEDRKGNYIDTLFITDLAGKGSWENKNVKRPSCFPIWAFSRGIETLPGYFMPILEKPVSDSITSATPVKDFSITWSIPDNLQHNIYKIKVEINSSYDYNKYYSNRDKKNINYHLFNGQPSLLWGTKIKIGGYPQEIKLKLIGHGDVNGKNGKIYTDLSQITTANKMIESIIVKFYP